MGIERAVADVREAQFVDAAVEDGVRAAVEARRAEPRLTTPLVLYYAEQQQSKVSTGRRKYLFWCLQERSRALTASTS